MTISRFLIPMRFLRYLLTLSGAACIGLALGYVAADLPFYHVANVVTVARCSLVLSAGIASFIIGYGFHRRPALTSWWMGCFAYLILLGYFFWRAVSRIEMFSYFVVIALIAEMPFAAMWWRYTKLCSGKNKDS